jgi:RNA polymerase sigma-70 factor, ECF subfamily
MATTEDAAQDRADMAELAGGRDAALNALMSRHGERLYHYLIRLVRDESEAADLAQETFVRVYQNRTRFKADGKFSTWLYAIATNLARDHFRKLARRPQVSLQAEDESGTSLSHTLAAGEAGPHESLEAAERAEAVREAVAALPEELRLPLILAEYEEQSHAEIASVLECTPKAVEMRLYRARQQLRTRLEKLLPAI